MVRKKKEYQNQEFHLASGLLSKILTWFAKRYNAHWGWSMYGTQSCGLWRLSQVTNMFVLGIDAAVFFASQLVRKLAKVTQPDRWFCPSIQVSASSQARTLRLKKCYWYCSSRSYMWTSNLKGSEYTQKILLGITSTESSHPSRPNHRHSIEITPL